MRKEIYQKNGTQTDDDDTDKDNKTQKQKTYSRRAAKIYERK